MLNGLGVLLGFLLAGDAASRLLHLFVPGPIIGLLLLFAWLQARAFIDMVAIAPIEPLEIEPVAMFLLRNLGILFVPLGVGVVGIRDLFAERGAAIVCVVVASTLLTMTATAVAFQAAQWLVERAALPRRRAPARISVVPYRPGDARVTPRDDGMPIP
jgi:holin-like protein